MPGPCRLSTTPLRAYLHSMGRTAHVSMCMHADKDSPPPPKRSHAKAGKGTKLPRPTDPLSCPRCCSEDTKFCYYNNYNSKQPRYFCKVRGANALSFAPSAPFPACCCPY